MMMATAMREPPNKRIDQKILTIVKCLRIIILSKYIFYTAIKQQCVVTACTLENMNHNKKIILVLTLMDPVDKVSVRSMAKSGLYCS